VRVQTYFASNLPTEVPWLNVSLGDFMVLVFVLVGSGSFLGFVFVTLMGFKGWFVSLAIGSGAFLGLWLFVRDNWGKTIPKEREVFATLWAWLTATRILEFDAP